MKTVFTHHLFGHLPRGGGIHGQQAICLSAYSYLGCFISSNNGISINQSIYLANYATTKMNVNKTM